MTAKKKSPTPPALRHHKPSGRACVRIDGRDIYLGRFGTPEATAAYFRLVAEYTSSGNRLPVPQAEITIDEVIAKYLAYCKTYYHDPRTGKPSSTYTEINVSLKAVLDLYAGAPAAKFGPVALRAVRQGWIDGSEERPGLAITTINSYVGNVKACFKWATSHQLIPVEVHQGLTTLTGLRRGRGVGKDPVQRLPAPLGDVEKTIPFLPRPLQAVVRILLLTGARPSEVLSLKRGDVDTKGAVWVAIIRHHKTSYQGKQRRLFFGPRAQVALRPYLLRPDGEYLFQPRDAIDARFEKDRKADDYVGRRPDQKPNRRKSERTLNDHYSYTGLNVAVDRVCAKQGIAKWTPYQLRHLAATTIEATADLQTAAAILGHSGLDITQVYVHRDNKTAAAWALSNG